MTWRPPRATSIGLLVALCACGGPRAVGVSRLVVDTDSASFGAVAHGTLHEITLDVHNSGSAAARAVLSVEAPFSLQNDTLVLGADERGELSVFFLPTTYDSAEATLVLRVEGQQLPIDIDASVITDLDEDGELALGAGGDDCDDTRADVRPGLDETCDGIDNDCDDAIDEDAVDASVFYGDSDGDGFGDPDDPISACEAPTGAVSNADDCDDSSRFVAPGATERSDGVDQDCDGRVDEHLLTPGSLVITEVHAGIEGELLPYVELRLGDPPAPLYLEGLEVHLGALAIPLAGDGVGYRSDVDPVLLLCGEDAIGQVGGRACVGRLPAAIDGSERLELRSESTVDAVELGGLPLAPGQSAELSPSADASDNDDPAAWCSATAPLGTGFGSPGIVGAHCRDPSL